MRNDGGAQTDLNAVMNLHVLGIFILEIDVVANEYLALDLHASKAVQERAKRRRARTRAGELMEDPVAGPSQ
jgi:hypothetical protein